MFIRQMLQSVLITTILPGIVFTVLTQRSQGNCKPDTAPNSQSVSISVLMDNGSTQVMDLEEYVRNVLLGEVPAEFEIEALKAQAVAVRTYTLRNMKLAAKHKEAAVCTDYRCCQAYMEPEEYYDLGGSKRDVAKIENAVQQTRAQVLSYDSQLICATYFACSGGCTEDAEEVWGEPYPYLKAVKSPGEEECGYFQKSTVLTPRELQEFLGVELEGNPEDWFGFVLHTASGAVDLMRIGGRIYTGVELRKMLGLRSTIFDIRHEDGKIIFDTKGYGHRVGMSQHGANAMAKTGAEYNEILSHYYLNTSLEHYEPESH